MTLFHGECRTEEGLQPESPLQAWLTIRIYERRRTDADSGLGKDGLYVIDNE